jgi:hypothetical protein
MPRAEIHRECVHGKAGLGESSNQAIHEVRSGPTRGPLRLTSTLARTPWKAPRMILTHAFIIEYRFDRVKGFPTSFDCELQHVS